MARKRLGELLVEAGVIDELQLRSALAEQRKFGRPLGRVLVEMRMVSEDAMVNVLSHQLNIPAVKLDSRPLEPAALRLLDLEFCQRYACVPFAYQERGKFLDVAMADPTNQEIFDQVRVRTRCNVRPYLSGVMSIDTALKRAYPSSVTPTEPPESWMGVRTDEPMFELDGRRGTPPSREVPAIATGRSSVEIDLDQDPPAPSVSVRVTPSGATPPAGTASDPQLDEVLAQVSQMKALIDRDEKVLRRLLGLLIEKGIFSRDELLARLRED
ncbi:MAG: hypothetical protein IT371_18055 [Deltaproteobacteria bacterium]|nr:hypothetical protein [Deltaproteobacteria bacterium]